jgi:hypothetical protein
LWVSGVLLWAYVVMGIFTTTPLPFTDKHLPVAEGTAFLSVMVAALGAGFLSVRRSLVLSAGEPGPRAGGIALGAISFWFLFVLVAIAFGSAGFQESFITLLLVLVSAAAVWNGRRLTNRGSRDPNASRLLAIGCWIGAVVVTLMALSVR